LGDIRGLIEAALVANRRKTITGAQRDAEVMA
jgi:hypothetical protein